MKNAVVEAGPAPGIKLVRSDEDKIAVYVTDSLVGVMGPGWSYTPAKGVIKMPKKGVDKCSDRTLFRIASKAIKEYERFRGGAKQAGSLPSLAVK